MKVVGEGERPDLVPDPIVSIEEWATACRERLAAAGFTREAVEASRAWRQRIGLHVWSDAA